MPRTGSLAGLSIMLSASVPAKYRSQDYLTDGDRDLALRRAEMYGREVDAAFVIADAVVSLARAVFVHSGRLVFGGHPAISPLVATVAGEYFKAGTRVLAGDVADIHIYQSRIFEGYEPAGTRSLAASYQATVHWTERQGGEYLEPGTKPDAQNFPLSLAHMRDVMIGEGKPVALVCAGGMEGVEKEVQRFDAARRELGVRPDLMPIYVLATTGGAALRMARGQSCDIDTRTLRVIDLELADRLGHAVKELSARADFAGIDIGQPDAVTYPLIMQAIIEEIASNRNGSWTPG